MPWRVFFLSSTFYHNCLIVSVIYLFVCFCFLLTKVSEVWMGFSAPWFLENPAVSEETALWLQRCHWLPSPVLVEQGRGSHSPGCYHAMTTLSREGTIQPQEGISPHLSIAISS